MDTQTLTLTPTETGTRTLGTETLSLTLRTATETGTETLRTETLSLTLRTATETGTKTLRTGTATSTLGTRSATSSIVAETPSTTLTAATRTSTATLPTETATLYVTPTRVVVPTETPIVIQPSDDESFLNRWLIVLILGGLILIICILVLCVWKKSRNQKKKTRTPLPAHEPEDIPLVVDEGYERFGFEEKAQDSHMEMPYKPPELDKPPDTTLTPSEVSGKTENINNTKLATEKSASFFPSTGAHPTVIYGSPRVLSDDPGKASSSKAQSIHLSRYLKGLSSEGTPERPLTAWELPQTEAATYYSMPPSPYGRGRGALDPTFTHPSNNLHY